MTTIPLGAVELALRTGADLIPAWAWRIDGFRFRAVIGPPMELVRTAISTPTCARTRSACWLCSRRSYGRTPVSGRCWRQSGIGASRASTKRAARTGRYPTIEAVGTADLHIHTALGDGMAEIPELARLRRGETDLDVIAITEHDDLRRRTRRARGLGARQLSLRVASSAKR